MCNIILCFLQECGEGCGGVPDFVKRFVFKNVGILLGVVSDCEELVVPPEEASRQKCD